MKKTIEKLKKFWGNISNKLPANTILVFKPSYRVVSIEKNKLGDYEITVQLIGKSTIFKMKPEEILANDQLTDQFSPRDVRALTYLGYLDINSPKYRILAKKLSEKDNHMLFALHKKGDKKLQIKTASEISQDKEIIKQIDQQDAHMIGFMAASDSIVKEKITKEETLKQLQESPNKKDKTDAFIKVNLAPKQ